VDLVWEIDDYHVANECKYYRNESFDDENSSPASESCHAFHLNNAICQNVTKSRREDVDCKESGNIKTKVSDCTENKQETYRF